MQQDKPIYYTSNNIILYLFNNYQDNNTEQLVMSSTLTDFQIINKIGQGMYSIVYKVHRIKDGNIYALKQVKLIDMPQKQVYNAINQVRILASIRHPNVICYKQAFYDQYTKTLCRSIVMEYADGGDLDQKITDHRNRGQYFKENQIWDMFGQMLSGLGRLHDLGILHRDVKSANFYLTRNGAIKIGDMNVSKIIRKTGMCETQTGAPYYASPQVWKQQAYDVKSDMWSLGCVLYEVINLKLPFKARDMEGLFKKVTRGYYSRINKSYNEQLSQVLKYMLNINPKQRKYCRQIMQIPFVKANIKRQKQADLNQKSSLLKTIKLNKNLSYIGNNLPKPNYQPLKYKYTSLNNSMIQKSYSQQFKINNNSSLNKLQKISSVRMKLSLPPLSTQALANKSKIYRYGQQPIDLSKSSSKRKISSQKNYPRHRKARSYIKN